MRCRISGSFGDNEIPLLVMLFYLFHDATSVTPRGVAVLDLSFGESRGRQRQVGSLAGAAHLLNDNTGVLG